MSLLVVGASYRTADVTLLERLSIAAADLPAVLNALLLREHVTEAVVLSTCNRVEVYAGVASFHGGLADVSATLAARVGVDPAVLARHLYVHWDTDAVTHALRVATGLDSMVAGEAQILGQVREAYAVAADADAAGRLLHDLMQQALRVGKRAHAETSIDAAGRSVVSAALDLAANAFAGGAEAAAGASGPLAGRPALVIGTGSMGALSLATLSRAGAVPRYVASRTRERAARLAAAYDAEPVTLADLAELAADIDLVVSATASPQPVLSTAAVAELAARRPADRGPLVICDLAVPRDVEPAVGELPGVVLVDLTTMATAVPEDAVADIDAVAAIVAEEAAAIGSNLRDAVVAPTVAALRARADEVVGAELARLAHRLPELTPTQRAEVAHAVHRLVQRLLHQPTVRVRQLAAEPGGPSYAAVLAELFDLQLPQPCRADQVPGLTDEPEQVPGVAGAPEWRGGKAA